jgi:hypothetical protein
VTQCCISYYPLIRVYVQELVQQIKCMLACVRNQLRPKNIGSVEKEIVENWSKYTCTSRVVFELVHGNDSSIDSAKGD